ncbi:helix-turn-helix transcriptional regulator [Nitratireductor thuwali]|uniref:Transcriptional activator protein LuxR n=1 Tax=Nitratireductor thuwali TaxID=2267699 RepID=A0ABY5MIB9_9HYPH|nr:Transcriptional activator protein LuxR [Nitratireductor thuwali]
MNLQDAAEADPQAVARTAAALETVRSELGASALFLFRTRTGGAQRSRRPELALPGHASPLDTLPQSLLGALFGANAGAICLFWWADDADSALPAALAGIEGARRLPCEACGEGIGFGLSDEADRSGLVIVAGSKLRAAATSLVELHLRCLSAFAALPEALRRGDGRSTSLSRREIQCLKLTANGLTSEDMARKLGLSVHTANQYLANATQKLDAVNRVQAVAKALRGGLIV